MAYFEFSPGTSAESARIVGDVIRLAKAGCRVDAGELVEKRGMRLRAMAGERRRRG